MRVVGIVEQPINHDDNIIVMAMAEITFLLECQDFIPFKWILYMNVWLSVHKFASMPGVNST